MQRETQQLGNIACQRDLLWQLLVTRSGLDSELLPERPPAHNHRMRTYWNYCNAPSGVLFSPGVGIAKKDRGSVPSEVANLECISMVCDQRSGEFIYQVKLD